MPAAPPEALDGAQLFHRIAGARHVALAVSGGSDSVSLLRLAAQWRGGREVSVLTVDHGLRPGSAAEARQVTAWAGALGLPHHTLEWTGPKPASGIQARARTARYDLMAGWCLAHDAEWLLTGHTLDDQAETVLMRLSRTASLDSLAGIRRETGWQGVRVFRPLLGETRQRLRAYLGALGQGWIDDPSNEDQRFERVRLRRALPGLAQSGIGAAALAAIAREAGEASDALWAAARGWLAAEIKARPEGYAVIPTGAFAAEPAMTQVRIVALLTRRYGGGQPEPHESEALARWIVSGSPRRTLGGALFARRRSGVVIGREPGRIADRPLVVPATGRALWDNRFEVMAPPGAAVVAAGRLAGIARCESLPAFVQAALPAILEEGQPAAVPLLGIGGDGRQIAARFAS